MSIRSERKHAVVQEVKAAKQARKQRKAEIGALPPEQQAAEKQKDAALRKEEKAARKAQLRAMPKAERKAAKKHDKIYRKVSHRPRRAIVWAAVLCLALFVVATAAPYVASIMSLASVQLDSNTPAGIAARQHAATVSRQISDEGEVLLLNKDNALPLADKTMNVFGVTSFNIKYSGLGSGTADTSGAIDLYTALSEAGIQYNGALHDFYVAQGADAGGQSATGLAQLAGLLLGTGKAAEEPDIGYLTDDVIRQAADFSPNAMLVVSSLAAETSDLTKESLSLSANTVALLEKVCANFENVIVVVNAGNAMQLGFLKDYPSIKAAVWMGTPGLTGCQSLAGILAGDVNPSGRLVDTYAYDVMSAPSTVNLGDYPYDNIDNMAFLNYQEGIYVGYRYYETRYAGEEAAYNAAVQFPFGYGLSYTTFKWEAGPRDFDGKTFRIGVKVTNTGKVAGKDVVQVYFAPPYTEGGIEKSAIELAGYAKTDLLQPGESGTVTIEFPVRDMASYDVARGAYVLEAGMYDIYVSKNVHAKPDQVMQYQLAKETVYDKDEVTNTPIQNQFGYAAGDFTELSRADWDGTYPDAADRSYTAGDEVAQEFAYTPAKVAGEQPTTGADNGVMLADLKGLAYGDPKWDAFLDQFTLDEMREMFTHGAYATQPVERLGVPRTVLLDGPAGFNSFFSPVTAAAYPTEVVIASTWNDALAEAVGDSVGQEAVAYGIQGWYAPGMNIHRTAMGGRNFEYFSEDPLLSGKMAAGMVRGAQQHNIIVTLKHFVLNDQEINARKGVAVWVNEQAMRELYLRPFEIATKEADATGAMSSFIMIGPKWAGGNPELLENVLRGEWGFDGVVTTDAVLGDWMDQNLAVRCGNELMLAPFPTNKPFDKAYKADPVGISTAVRDRVHTICYAIVNDTYLFN